MKARQTSPNHQLKMENNAYRNEEKPKVHPHVSRTLDLKKKKGPGNLSGGARKLQLIQTREGLKGQQTTSSGRSRTGERSSTGGKSIKSGDEPGGRAKASPGTHTHGRDATRTRFSGGYLRIPSKPRTGSFINARKIPRKNKSNKTTLPTLGAGQPV